MIPRDVAEIAVVCFEILVLLKVDDARIVADLQKDINRARFLSLAEVFIVGGIIATAFRSSGFVAWFGIAFVVIALAVLVFGGLKRAN